MSVIESHELDIANVIFPGDLSTRLQETLNSAPKPATQLDEEILDLSRKCLTTAKDLQDELEKYQTGSQRGLRQVVSKGTRAMWKGSTLDEIQKRLETHQRTLNTSILVRLQASNLQYTKNFDDLDKHAQNLIVSLRGYHDALSQVVANQGKITRDHIDRQLKGENYVSPSDKAVLVKEFKKSLFFPEMFSRQRQVPDAHQGTCKWILKPP